MKRLVFVIAVAALAGYVAFRFAGVTQQVEFGFVHEINGRQVPLEPIKFAIIADIHLRENVREEIPGEAVTRAILDRFHDSMNQVVKPDFIVQLGDLNDGCLDRCAGIDDALVIRRIERAVAYTEKKSPFPWFHVIGNHEYASAYDDQLRVKTNKDFSPIYRAINPSWSNLEDTWYYRDIKGYRFVFLNTSYPHDGPVHQVPPAQIEWLESLLKSSTQPVFVFMHVAISAGVGTPYDYVVNQERVSQLLAEDDSFVIGFFGHSHHSDKWDGLRRQLDDSGNVFYHTTAPHQWMGNTESYPWTIVTIDPQQGRITIEAGAEVYRSEWSEFWHYAKERIVKTFTRLTRKLAN